MEFIWRMTEADWKRLKDTTKKRKYDSNNVFGECYVGGVCCDFVHTMDVSDWYAFINLFFVNEDSAYGELDDGTKYDLYDDSPEIPIKCRTFASFKKNFEKKFERFINEHEELKSLENVNVNWR